MILQPMLLADLRLRVFKIAHTVPLLLLIACLLAPAADARPLSKTKARTEALAFVSPFVDLTDLDHTIRTVMTPPRDCLRVNRSTVACRFAFVLAGRTVRGRAVIHRQRDGLLGIRVTPDLSDYWI